MQAAMGLVQLNHWDEIMRKRNNVYLQYVHNLILDDRIKLQQFCDKWEQLSHFVFTIEIDNRDKVMQYLLSHGVECRAYFPTIHTQKPYLEIGYKKGDFPVAELVSSRTLAIPFFTDMQESEVDEVCRVLKEALR
jgi:perosamine synthetase